MKTAYFLNSINAQLMSMKAILLYVLLGTSPEAETLIQKYDDLAEEIAEAIAEINERGDIN